MSIVSDFQRGVGFIAIEGCQGRLLLNPSGGFEIVRVVDSAWDTQS